ncbi:hypothetical protein ABAC460_17450 [Asticcacaulis sp. AC460]|uniref:cytochrome c/FTR1 family iron permease n=1 Tax=Asticcacaulis sp. AC460 TaxID=1282360 RepID=UPI0003C3D866|nr:cytochrome c/FTR1 family iron permease [Asticcacaulis sp. AC460]ESQ87978.1 hypothetical protein ABAC460_17450 [Asticcacaulis sp. AC460]
MPTSLLLRIFSILCCTLILAVGAAQARAAETNDAQVAWRLLDYIAVDYREAISDGKVTNAAEYAEMTEFARSAKTRIEGLRRTSQKPVLLTKATSLQQAIDRKDAPDIIAVQARELAQALITAYPVPLAPAFPPDWERGHVLYAETCASCHGATGDGKGPASERLDPPPIAFNDHGRARERSIFGLYQVIEQGIDGTSMPSFSQLPPQDRWALAFYVGSIAFPESSKGERIWQDEPALHPDVTLERLVSTTPATMGAQVGDEKADALVAYLRRNPSAVVPSSTGSLALSKARLQEAVAAYERGDRKAANDLALSAYLDGFEPVEAVLATHDKALMIRIEEAMGALRSGITQGAPVATVRQQAKTLEGLFSQAEEVIAPGRTSAGSSFVGAFTILLREGLEALLIVLAMITFLRRAERTDVLPYVHGGWVAALVAGGATWAIATFAIGVSGASRELTEGFGSLFAAVVLVWVGIWMHGKSNADAWQRYIRDKLTHALNKQSAWFLFGLSFLVVYREVFETILFYAAIWSRGNGIAVIGGALSAILALAVIGWAMVRFSRSLPIGKFFAYSSALISVLAVVLIGKAVSALQEAGYMPIHPMAGFPRVEILGIYPTLEGLGAQLVIAGIIAGGYLYNSKTATT